jgi:hypothetical protein
LEDAVQTHNAGSVDADYYFAVGSVEEYGGKK